jgi:uncharacterized cysteine cluster protein YcgN (CxxCxxCC family)
MTSDDPNGTGEGENAPFWRSKTLAEMTRDEWESLCDGCGRCCLNKIEYEDTGEIVWTDVACRLLDDATCRCRDYGHRHALVPDCLALTADNVPRIKWLPPTCGYRLVAERRDLYWWHPLVSGDPESVHAAGISTRARTVSEESVAVADFEDHVVTWPVEVPRRARAR